MLTTYFTKLLLGEKKMLLRLYRISIVTKRSSEINFQFPAQGFRGNLLKVVPGPESFYFVFYGDDGRKEFHIGLTLKQWEGEAEQP